MYYTKELTNSPPACTYVYLHTTTSQMMHPVQPPAGGASSDSLFLEATANSHIRLKGEEGETPPLRENQASLAHHLSRSLREENASTARKTCHHHHQGDDQEGPRRHQVVVVEVMLKRSHWLPRLWRSEGSMDQGHLLPCNVRMWCSRCIYTYTHVQCTVYTCI